MPETSDVITVLFFIALVTVAFGLYASYHKGYTDGKKDADMSLIDVSKMQCPEFQEICASITNKAMNATMDAIDGLSSCCSEEKCDRVCLKQLELRMMLQ